MKLYKKFLKKIENGEPIYDNVKFAKDLQAIANKHFEQLTIPVVGSRLSFEEMVWKKRFPDEDFDGDNFYDWAAENDKEAFYVCIDVARDLGL